MNEETKPRVRPGAGARIFDEGVILIRRGAVSSPRHKPYIPMLAENNVRKGFFEHAEFVAFRAQFSAELQGVLTFAYYTGWRKREILTLRWNPVDVSNRIVKLDPGTTN